MNSHSSPDKKKPRLVTPEELASAPKTQALMVELIDRPEKAAEKVKGEVPQLQAGITALFEALSECGIHAASLERELATAKRQACTSEHRTICSFASSARNTPDLAGLLRRARHAGDLGYHGGGRNIDGCELCQLGNLIDEALALSDGGGA